MITLALSLSNSITKIGALAGFAAILGIALLSLLYFSQAREVRRLREWAGRAPERAADLEQRVAAEAAARAQRAAFPPRPGATPVRAVAAAGPASRVVGPELVAAAPASPQTGVQAAEPDPVQGIPAQPGPEHAEAEPSPAIVAGAPVGGEEHVASVAAGAPDSAPGSPVPAPPGVPDAAAGSPVPVPGSPIPVPAPSIPGLGPSDVPEAAIAAPADITPAPPASPALPAGPGMPGEIAAFAAGEAAEPAPPPPATAAASARAAGAIPRASIPPAYGVDDPALAIDDEPALPRRLPPRPPAPAGPRRGAVQGGRSRASGRRAGPLAPLEPRRSGGRLAAVVGGVVVGVVVLVVLAMAVLGGGGGGKAKTSAGVSTRSTTSSTKGAPASRPARTVGVAGNPATLAVAVINSTTIDGLARSLSHDLNQKGYNASTYLRVQPPTASATSTVYYRAGHRADADGVARALGVSVVAPINSSTRSLAGAASVVVVAGTDQAAAAPGQ